jgi:hypothetical protein
VRAAGDQPEHHGIDDGDDRGSGAVGGAPVTEVTA